MFSFQLQLKCCHRKVIIDADVIDAGLELRNQN